MSQTEAKRFVIGNLEYTQFMLPVRLSCRTLEKITRIVGPSLGALPQIMEKDLASSSTSQAIKEFVDRFSTDELFEIAKTFADVTFVNGAKVSVDAHFNARLMDLFSFVFQSFKVQYADFWNAAIATFRDARPEVETKVSGSEFPMV